MDCSQDRFHCHVDVLKLNMGFDGFVGYELYFPSREEGVRNACGMRPRTFEAWVKVCLENMFAEGFCTDGPNYRLTPAGRAYLGIATRGP